MSHRHPAPGPRRKRKTNWGRRFRHFFLKQIPRRKHMHGGRLHRLLGDRLFDPHLWKPTRDTFAGGMAVGLFIGLMPTYYLQLILAFLFCYFLRVNVSAAMLGTVVTNPITTPPIILLQYKLGIYIVGKPTPEDLTQYTGVSKMVVGHALPYIVGSGVSAVVAAILGYFLTQWLWTGTVKLEEKVLHRHHHEGLAHEASHGESAHPGPNDSPVP